MTELQSLRPNRRRRIRHKILTPAYASFMGESKAVTLDLNEIVDISEDGVAVQCNAPLELNRSFELCLDLSESSSPIYTTAQVIWSSTSGRSGFRFSDLPPTSLLLLREWLFLNAMAGAANAQGAAALPPMPQVQTPPRPNYTDTLAALGAVQREAESLGSDLASALRLIAARAQALLRASGAAIAVASADPNIMVCRASSGTDAPPVGAKLQVGAGFSGECVRSATPLSCADAETDTRVDRESCRALGIRSILAAPLRAAERVIGIIEVFSPAPNAFSQNDRTALERLADTVVAAVNRTAQAQEPTPSTSRGRTVSSPGSVLFASQVAPDDKKDLEEKASGGIHLPRSQLVILICAAAAISLALGFLLRPWIQERLSASRGDKDHTVLAASRTAAKSSASASRTASSDAETLAQLLDQARQGNPSAQYSLGMRYNLGDGVKQNYSEAARWFSRAADQGHVLAEGALGDYYNYGRGVPVDISKAYFWSYLAFAGGDEVSRLRLGRLAGQLPHSQIVRVQQQAEAWFHQHPVSSPQ